MADLLTCPICGQRTHFRYRMPFSIIECKSCGYQLSQADCYSASDGKSELLKTWKRLHTMKDLAEGRKSSGKKKQGIRPVKVSELD